MIFSNSILPAIVLWLVVILFYFAKNHTWKVKKFTFSVSHYYLMMSPFVAGVIYDSWKSHLIQPILLFVVFAVAGVIGETLADLWWQIFFTKGLWVYNVKTAFKRFTSWLNFLPWGVGGLMYFYVATKLTDQFSFPEIGLISLMILGPGIMLQIFLFKLIKLGSNFKFSQASGINLLIIYSPTIFGICILAQIYGPIIYKLAIWFAVVGTVAEYLFGKACSFFISRKLWDYTYWSVDDGHFTPLSIPLFAVGGFWFWIIGILIQQHFR